MKKNYKTYLNILAVVVFVLAANWLYKKFFFEKDLQQHSEIINQIRDLRDTTDILYIGESSNNTYHSSDIDKRAISEMLGDWYPDLEVSDITYPASHAGIYKDILRAIPNDKVIHTVVVTLNLRSFNAQWIYSDLETQLRKSMVLLKPWPPLVNRFLLSFKAYNNDSKRERKALIRHKWKHDELVFPEPFHIDNTYDWDGYHWRNGGRNQEGDMDLALKELACHYVKGYGFQIDPDDNPRIRDFDDIVKIAEKRGWHLVFNLMAENTERAQEIIGDNLIYCMEYNRKLLCDYYRAKGVDVVDNFYIAPNEQFIDQDWTTEHYKAPTRWSIAENLAMSLKNWHSLEYTNAIFNNRIRLCHDCESEYGWGQEQTIVVGNANSGTSASLVTEDSPYSITLDYNIPEKKASLDLSFSFYLFRTALETDDSFVIEVYEGDKKYRKSIILNDLNQEINKWRQVCYSTSVSIGTSRVKTYIYNPSGVPLVVDDFCLNKID